VGRPRLLSGALIALVAVLALALLSGCGQSKTDKFKSDYLPLNDQLLTLGRDVGRGVSTASGKRDTELAREFGGFADRTATLRGQIADLKPPDKLRADHRDLVAALASLRDDLRAIQTAAKRNDGPRARTATVALIRDSVRERRSRSALARATGAKLG
jgi:outer membrane murein-binding lipoprotein Lpp